MTKRNQQTSLTLTLLLSVCITTNASANEPEANNVPVERRAVPGSLAATDCQDDDSIATLYGGKIDMRGFAPKYPRQVLANCAAGEVLLDLLVNPKGRVTEVLIAQSSGRLSFDLSAQKAVTHWRLEPRGCPYRTQYRVHFKPPMSTCLRYAVAEDITKAELDSMMANPPHYPRELLDAGIEGEVLLMIRIDAHGRVMERSIHQSSGNELLDAAALDAAQRWQFREGRDPYLVVPVRFKVTD